MAWIYPNYTKYTSAGLYPDWVGKVLEEFNYVGDGIIWVYGTAITEGPVAVPIVNSIFFGIHM